MSHDEPPAQRWQLRVLDGPLRGTVHVLGERTSIGRSASSDLQIIDTGVSRQHAMIVRNGDGEHVVIDLASANGTLVDGRRVDRQVLRPNTVVRIVDTELAFEASSVPSKAGPKLGSGETDVRTLRGTMELRAQDTELIPPGAPSPVGEVLAGDSDHLVIFDGPDGTEHSGLLIDDILEYRRLRSKCLRGGLATPEQRRHFHALQERLRQPPAPPPASKRAFCRFDCWFPATLRFASGDDKPCWVRDFGVDGAQLKIEGHQIHRNSITWLAMHLRVDGRPRSEVLAGRVVWTDDDYLGLAFTGPPRSEDGRYTSGPAVREVVEDTRPMREAKPLRLANGDD